MILQRYILGQILWPTVSAFLSLSLLFLVVQLLKVGDVAVGSGLGAADLARVVGLMLPSFAVLIVPISVLCGVLLGFGRMAEDGELVALAGAGAGPGRLARMPLLLGGLAAALAAVVAWWVAPAATARLHGAFVELSKRHLAASLQPGVFFDDIPYMILYGRRPAEDGAGEAGGQSWDGFLLYDHRPGRDRHILTAERARIRPAAGNVLRLDLAEGESHRYQAEKDVYTLGAFRRATVGIDVDRMVYDATRFIPRAERMSSAALARAAHDPALSMFDRNRMSSAWHRRLAFPAAALLFALLGVALGASGRLRGARRTLLAAVMVVAGYYLLMRMGDAGVDAGWTGPAMAAWAPDVLVGLVALGWLWRRGRRPG